MIYPDNFEQKVGFDTIRGMVKRACLSPLGQQRVDEMGFSANFDEVAERLGETEEFRKILAEEEFPTDHFFDVRLVLERLRIENTYPTPEELWDVKRSLEAIEKIKDFFYGDKNGSGSTREEVREKYLKLAGLVEEMQTFQSVTKRIDQILDRYGDVKDTASAALYDIRKTKTNVAGSISRLLQSILGKAKTEGLVEKDASPAMRDGRLVIPVAPGMKRKISGIVHDESDSGKTVYIEPAEVVEANNKVRELEAEERREIVRILTEVADEIRPEIDNMRDAYETMATIDFIRAKARVATDMGAVLPNINKVQQIDWSMAKHPLLKGKAFQREQVAGSREQVTLREQVTTNKVVVPLDIELTKKDRILVISGPNAGGKSVCLKTVGLLQYMLQCGMLVPMAESSRCGMFEKIFIDIGDEQSLENDLSTYSSHLLNMKHMMRHASSRTLILIDEFGGGTEPQIGGAIAEAVLKRFNQKHAFGVITTHYQNLKHYAKDTPGVVNGAMLYDRVEMRPLFQLKIGNPGSSFAVEIARKIGIPEDVIEDASALVGQDYINADKYLQDIVRDKRYWENKRQLIHQKEKALEVRIEEYEEKSKAIKAERREIMDKARQEAEQLLESSNALIERTIKEIKEAKAEKEKTKKIRAKVQEFKEKSLSPKPSPVERKIKVSPKGGDSEGTIAEGNYARLKGQSAVGLITKINGDEAQIEFDSIQTKVKLNRLEPARKPAAKARVSSSMIQVSNLTQKAFKPSIDVRGMRGDDCLAEITQFIDQAVMTGVASVSILHGTGTGILKTLIRQYLNTRPEVRSFHDEHPDFGGAGITIAEF